MRSWLVSFRWLTHIGHKVSLESALLIDFWADLHVWAALSCVPVEQPLSTVHKGGRGGGKYPWRSVLPDTGTQGGHSSSSTNFTLSVTQSSGVDMSISFEDTGGHYSVTPLCLSSWCPRSLLSLRSCCRVVLPWVGLKPNMPPRNGGTLHASLQASHLSSLLVSVCGSLGCS